jgi:CRISPR system Cascade subunit CasE
MIASILTLSRADIKALRITDEYSLHRVVYSLFEDQRSERDKHSSVPSGFLFADRGGDAKGRRVLILSDREPLTPAHGSLLSKPLPEAFFHFPAYRFEVTLNPARKESGSGKRIPIKTTEEVAAWALAKAKGSWGFSIDPSSLQVQMLPAKQFFKQGHQVTHGAAKLKGVLRVEDCERFITSFRQGIGRGRAFGFGLLQLAPLKDISNN